jgi:predicted nuclease of predicted toxin-antitoxin system
MKFLVDAQLPRRLVTLLRQAGYDAIHTLDLPLGNRTTDTIINELSINEQRVVVTKDSDFVDSRVLLGQPWKLLLVSTGNIHNTELIPLFLANIDRIAEGFESFDFIEINRTNVIFHF